MTDTVTLQTLLIAVGPIALLLLATLFATVLSGAFQAAWDRLRGQPSQLDELERRISTLEVALKRARAARASELPIEIEAERLSDEIRHAEQQRASTPPAAPSPSPVQPDHAVNDAVSIEPVSDPVADARPVDASADSQASVEEPEAEPTPEPTPAPVLARESLIVDLPPDPDESEEDRLAREQLEAEALERIEQLAAEEARIRQEREDAERQNRERLEAEAKRRREEQEERDRIERMRREEEERIERERLEAEAQRRREEEQRRKAEEFRRRVADATPKIVMSAGGSNREAVTINVEVTNNLTPKRAEIAVLTTSWARKPAPATFETQRKDGLYEERWPKLPRNGETPAWGTYTDTTGRTFECPDEEPTADQAWIVISYERTAGGPASTWQRFEVAGAGALWYVRQPAGDPIVIEAARDENAEEADAA